MPAQRTGRILPRRKGKHDVKTAPVKPTEQKRCQHATSRTCCSESGVFSTYIRICPNPSKFISCGLHFSTKCICIDPVKLATAARSHTAGDCGELTTEGHSRAHTKSTGQHTKNASGLQGTTTCRLHNTRDPELGKTHSSPRNTNNQRAWSQGDSSFTASAKADGLEIR